MELLGVRFDPLTQQEVVEHVIAELNSGRGGHVITPNVDILRQLQKPDLRPLLRSVDVVVVDGTPILWASRLKGAALPERVTGADLIWSLAEAAVRRHLRVFLLGGAEGVAAEAGERLRHRYPGLQVVGTHSPPWGFERRPADMAEITDRLSATRPDLAFIGLGFPKQDLLASRLREQLPHAWFIGCGAALDFAAGGVSRAPRWMQDAGLEWVARLSHEPRRLFKRYVVDDAPFALRLLASSAVAGVLGRASSARRPR